MRAFNLLLLALLNCSAQAAALDRYQNRVQPLSRVTVGPWDNFQASVSGDESQLLFTRDRNQIPNLYRQQGNNQPEPLLQSNGDAKDPQLDAASQRLLFTSFRYDAQGDVCLVNLSEIKEQCISGPQTIDQSPFWIGSDKVGYLRRTALQLEWQLMIQPLPSAEANTKSLPESQVLFSGNLAAPSASPDGRYLLFTEIDTDNRRQLKIYDFRNQQLHNAPRFDLPGSSGFSSFSRDSNTLYFSHFLSDTNGDQRIDGNDHGVVFRVPFTKLLSGVESLFPEQLTSVADNCKFPASSDSHLYLTCAFEGSLDIYRTELSGTVPKSWGEAELWEAHQSARSHEERLLLLNTLRYRFQLNDDAMLERLLSHHLEIGELTAARFYLKQLVNRYQNANKRELATFYQTLDQLLAVRSNKQRIPVGLVTARFRQQVEALRSQLPKGSKWRELSALVNAYLDMELEQPKAALKQLAKLDLSKPQLPLQKYLAIELYRQLLNEQQPAKLLSLYPQLYNDSALSEESRLYYAFEAVKLQAQVTTNLEQRRTALQQAQLSAGSDGVKALLQIELEGLELAQATTPQAEQTAFQQLSDKLKAEQQQPLLRRVLHTRAIQILAAAEKYQFMELLSRHWLVMTHISEMEYLNSSEQYAITMQEKGYGLIQQQQLQQAFATFYSAIRQTDDLEAHYQFISLALNPELKREEKMVQSYQQLEHEQLLGESRHYITALRALHSSEDPEKAEETALKELQQMGYRNVSPALRDLLLGSVYHQRLQRSQHGYQFDKQAFEQAHFHYMMALDFGRDNRRVSAAVWENLAQLHFDVRHYTLAADFFQRRLSYPFLNPQREAQLRWFSARALFYDNRVALAVKQAELAYQLARKDSSIDSVPFLERLAFYTLQAEQFEQAKPHYQQLLAESTPLSPLNRVKALTAYGYLLTKLGDANAAKQSFNDSLTLSSQLKEQPTNQWRLLKTDPIRYQLLAHGNLAQLATQEDKPDEALNQHRARIKLWQQMASDSQAYAYSERSRLSFMARDQQQSALLLEQMGRLDAAFQAMQNSLATAQSWLEESEDPAGSMLYRVVINHLSFALSHRDRIGGLAVEPLKGLVTGALKRFAELKHNSANLLFQQLQLELLWRAYQGQSLSEVLNHPRIELIKIEQPQNYHTLSDMAARLSEGA